MLHGCNVFNPPVIQFGPISAKLQQEARKTSGIRGNDLLRAMSLRLAVISHRFSKLDGIKLGHLCSVLLLGKTLVKVYQPHDKDMIRKSVWKHKRKTKAIIMGFD
jgi:hypothetical protein